ncbi:MAG: hypothetical protein ACTSV2_04025 [Candidatus Thorarchaeota archaeon]
MSIRKLELLVSVIIATILITILIIVVPQMTFDSPLFLDSGDHILYIEMSMGNPAQAPFGSRILKPLLAMVISWIVGIEVAAFSLTIFFIAGTAILVFVLMRYLSFGHELSLVGEITYLSLGYTSKLFIFNFWLVDMCLYFFLTLSIIAIVRKDDKLFLFSLILGTMAKEGMLIIVILYLILNYDSEKSKKDLIMKTVIYGVIASAIFISLRIFIVVPSDYSVFGELTEKGLTHLQSFITDPVTQITYLYARMWGFFVLLFVAVSLLRNYRKFLYLSPFIILVYLQIFITGTGLTNISRVLMMAAIPLIILQLDGIEESSNSSNVPNWIYIPISLSFFVLTAFNDIFDPTVEWVPGRFASMYTVNLTIQIIFLCAWLAFLGVFSFIISRAEKKLNKSVKDLSAEST